MFNSKRSLAETRVLITGASSGIGRALALALAAKGAQLLLTARRETRLVEVIAEIKRQGGAASYFAGDITEEGVRDRLVSLATQQLGGLDVLINNAGIGGVGTFASATAPRLRQIMEVNFFAPAELIRACLHLLRRSEDALVVNVGSVLGHCAVPKKSEYCASKFALHGLSDALRIELLDEGIDVLLVSPSTTKSEFFDHALRSCGKAASSRRSMTPQQVAQQVVRAMERRRREVILSPGGKALVLADRLFPTTLSRILHRFG